MRTQITVYLDSITKEWLAEYARKTCLRESEIVRLLVRREREIEWLSWALQQPDPTQGGLSRTLADIAEIRKRKSNGGRWSGHKRRKSKSQEKR